MRLTDLYQKDSRWCFSWTPTSRETFHEERLYLKAHLGDYDPVWDRGRQEWHISDGLYGDALSLLAELFENGQEWVDDMQE